MAPPFAIDTHTHTNFIDHNSPTCLAYLLVLYFDVLLERRKNKITTNSSFPHLHKEF